MSKAAAKNPQGSPKKGVKKAPKTQPTSGLIGSANINTQSSHADAETRAMTGIVEIMGRLERPQRTQVYNSVRNLGTISEKAATAVPRVLEALAGLQGEQRGRVLNYVATRYNLQETGAAETQDWNNEGLQEARGEDTSDSQGEGTAQTEQNTRSYAAGTM